MHGEPRQQDGQRDDSEEAARSANACHVLAGVAQSLGEALGPENDHADSFLLWATQLQSHVRHLRDPQAGQEVPAEHLRVVR